MSSSNGPKIMGVGSPIVDVLAQVPEAFIGTVSGAKGGMELVTQEEMEQILARLPGETSQAPGGSAGNTLFALARLGASAAFLGKVGADQPGEFYRQHFRDLGGDDSHFLVTNTAPTARCVSLITPDSERTMRTFLGAATLLAPEEVGPEVFEEFQFVHAEGYMLFNPTLAETMLRSAHRAGCTVSLDLGSFEVVRAAGDTLPRLLDRYVTAVFANEDEAAAFCGHDDAEQALDDLGRYCEIVAVKLGAKGALLGRGKERVRVPVQPVEQVLDTTGAGDYWAAGFLCGLMQGAPLAECGRLGAILGAAVVQHIGAYLAPASWENVFRAIRGGN